MRCPRGQHAEARGGENSPAAQAVQEERPASAKVFAGHDTHAPLLTAPGVFDAVPMGHGEHVGEIALQLLHSPPGAPPAAAQLAHTALLTRNGYGAEKNPSAQQMGAPGLLLVMAGHGTHAEFDEMREAYGAIYAGSFKAIPDRA